MQFTSRIINSAPLKVNLRSGARKTSTQDISYEETQQAITRAAPSGVTKVSLVTFYRDSKGCRQLRARTVGDELAEQALQRGKRPSRKAIRMANAIKLEQVLESGRFKSIREAAQRCGISRNTAAELLNMLNQSPEEIETILYETT